MVHRTGVVVVCLLAAGAWAQRTWTVDDDGPADFAVIQEAIDAAVDGDTVLVFQGLYGGINASGKAVAVIASAGNAHTFVETGPGEAGLVCEQGEGPGTLIKGFTFTSGATPSTPHRIGGASPRIDGCVFRDSEVGTGPVLSIVDGAPKFDGCVFAGNAVSGTGVVRAAGSGTLWLDCAFVGNTVAGWGAAVHVTGGSAELYSCELLDNTGDDASGALVCEEATVEMWECRVQGNSVTAAERSGGVLNRAGSLSMSRCLLIGNSGSSGGALYNEGECVLERCSFELNSSEDEGGAIAGPGALTATDCGFDENSSGAGGAVALPSGGSGTFVGCTFNDNRAEAGGAISSEVSGLVVIDSEFENNVAGEGGAVRTRLGGTFTGCSFQDNEASLGGAALQQIGPGTLALEDCELVLNDSLADRGAIEVAAGGDLRLSRCTVELNGSDERVGGAVFHHGGGKVEADSSSFVHNFADQAAGAITVSDSSRLEAVHCVFERNESEGTGGVAVEHGASALLIGCRFAENEGIGTGALRFVSAGDSAVLACSFHENEGQSAGSVYSRSSGLRVEQSQFRSNYGFFAGGIHSEDGALDIVGSRFTANESAVGDGSAIRCFDGFSLARSRICDNEPNPVAGDWSDGGGNCITRSCDDCECPGDRNGDFETDTTDMTAFLAEWAAQHGQDCSAGDCSADFDGNGRVDSADFIAFLNAWSAGCSG